MENSTDKIVNAKLGAIMMDYEQLANNHNMLLKILFEKKIINTDDWNKALEENLQEKKKMQEKVSGAINSNIKNSSKIVKL